MLPVWRRERGASQDGCQLKKCMHKERVSFESLEALALCPAGPMAAVVAATIVHGRWLRVRSDQCHRQRIFGERMGDGRLVWSFIHSKHSIPMAHLHFHLTARRLMPCRNWSDGKQNRTFWTIRFELVGWPLTFGGVDCLRCPTMIGPNSKTIKRWTWLEKITSCVQWPAEYHRQTWRVTLAEFSSYIYVCAFVVVVVVVICVVGCWSARRAVIYWGMASFIYLPIMFVSAGIDMAVRVR